MKKRVWVAGSLIAGLGAAGAVGDKNWMAPRIVFRETLVMDVDADVVGLAVEFFGPFANQCLARFVQRLLFGFTPVVVKEP